MSLVDQPKKIRPGEELDVGKLEAFLKDSLPDLHGSLEIKQFPSGHSNLTYLITAGRRDMVLRRPPFGRKAKTAHDMSREFRILERLRPYYPYCPAPLVYCEDESIMSVPFYLMERIRGVIVRREFPPNFDLNPSRVRALFTRLIEVHHELHAVDYRAAGLENFGKPLGYVERQVLGWNKRYREARTPDAPDCERVMAWLEANMPPDSDPPGVIHNDFRLDNVVLDSADPLKVIGVLDWEMATLGDPLMDLGGSLAYWVQRDDPEETQLMRMQPSHLEGAPTRAEIVETYARLSGRSIDNFDFYYCFGLFRLAVIAQQIYYRYYHGQTKDERFKMMIMGVAVLDRAAQRVIEGTGL